MKSRIHFIWNISINHIWYHRHMISHMISCTYDFMYIWCHMSWIWFRMWFCIMISHAHFIWKISINHIWFHTYQMDMKSYMISHVSCPGRFKSGQRVYVCGQRCNFVGQRKFNDHLKQMVQRAIFFSQMSSPTFFRAINGYTSIWETSEFLNA